jgi:hypothetical protein
MNLKPGVYESEYGNAVAWDGRRAVDLDMMEVVPVEVITPGRFLRSLEGEDRILMQSAVSHFGGTWV